MTLRTPIDRRAFLKTTALTGLASAAPLGCHGPPSPRRAAPPSALAPIPLSALEVVGAGIDTPEGVVAMRDGRVITSDHAGACAVIGADGAIRHIGKAVSPNGIAMDGQGRVLIANFGLSRKLSGPLQRLDLSTGRIETLAEAVNGRTLQASNFPAVSRDGSVYCTHTSWGPSVDRCIDPESRDGFIYRVTPAGKTEVVKAMSTPNGICFDAAERYLYVAPTAGGRIMRLERRADGSFGDPEPYGPFLGPTPARTSIADIQERMAPAARNRLGHADGLGFDAEGNLWVTLVFANKVVAITPDEKLIEVINDPAGDMVKMPTNLAWGGPALTDLYIAAPGKGHVVKAKSPVPGLAMAHHAV